MSIDGGLKQLLRKHIPRFDWQGVETGGTGRGIPDMNFCAPGGVEGWVECKLAEGWVVDLRPEQVGWALRRCRFGGRVWLAVRQRGASRGGERRDVLWLAHGSRTIDCRTLPRLHPDDTCDNGGPWVLRCEGGPSRWNWDLVASLLAGATPLAAS